MSKFKNMKDSQMLRVRVPKALYESIQAELHKKQDMQEMHDTIDEAGIQPGTKSWAKQMQQKKAGVKLETDKGKIRALLSDPKIRANCTYMTLGAEDPEQSLRLPNKFIEVLAYGEGAVSYGREAIIDYMKDVLGESPTDKLGYAFVEVDNGTKHWSDISSVDEDYQEDPTIHKKSNMKETYEIEESVLTDPNFISGVAAILGVGGTLAAAIVRDLRKAKTPEEKKQILGKAAQGIGRKMSGDIQEMNESVITDPNFISGVAAILGVGGALAAAIVRDLKRAKTPEEKKQILGKAAQGIGRKMSGGL
jgi:hypothetical protein